MVTVAKQLVSGAPRQPLPYGLFSVLTPRQPSDPHWENGVVWEPLSCDPASGIGDPDCENPSSTWGFPKSFAGYPGNGEATPFTVYGSDLCSPVGRRLSESQDRATQHLLAREEAAAESVIWNGVGPGVTGASTLNTPNLTTGAEVIGSELAPIVGLGLLEQWIAENYGSLGVIHLSRETATVLGQSGAIQPSGNQLKTRLGTPVVAGAGYPTSGSPTTGLAVVSPALFGYRSEIFTSSAREGDLLDRGTNDLYAVAERRYVVGWDPCGTAAVQVTLGCC